MNWWIKFGCKLTGWSSSVLSQCSEASKCKLSKYTSALLILILIWGVTGFCFAQRYIGLPTWACGFVSLFFITIVIMIERQIILTSERTFSMLASEQSLLSSWPSSGRPYSTRRCLARTSTSRWQIPSKYK